MKNYEDIDLLEVDFEQEFSRDLRVDEARVKLLEFYEQHKTDVFYLRQIEILFEKTY